ncbi:hypothetical protein V8E36_004504 [Tilletia maclaganii]
MPVFEDAHVTSMLHCDHLSGDGARRIQRSRSGPSASDGPGWIGVESGKQSAISDPAVERFFGVAELVSRVFEHLVYDRLDLSSLSKVSRRCRSIALPMLVETLNIRFTKADTFCTLFKSNPGLTAHVSFLRLWDDLAETASRREQVGSARRADAAYWTMLGNLIALFEEDRQTSMPILELSIGQLHFFEVRTQFLFKAPRLLGRMVSLRVLDDVQNEAMSSDGDAQAREAANDALETHGEQMTEGLSVLLRDCFDRQAGTGSSLQRFIFHAPEVEDLTYGRSIALPAFGPRLLHELSSALTRLDLRSESTVPPGLTILSLLDQAWPELRSVRLVMSVREPAFADDFATLMGELLNRAPRFEEVETRLEDDEHRLAPFAVDRISPLTSFGVESIILDKGQGRNLAVRDVTWDGEDGGTDLVLEEVAISSLRVLRGPFHAASAILQQDHHLRMIYAQKGRNSSASRTTSIADLDLHILVPKVTFLSLELDEHHSSPLDEGTDYPRPLEMFPDLFELVLLCRFALDGVDANNPLHALKILVSLLSRLNAASSPQPCKIRSIRVEAILAPLSLSADGCVSPSPPLPVLPEYITSAVHLTMSESDCGIHGTALAS